MTPRLSLLPKTAPFSSLPRACPIAVSTLWSGDLRSTVHSIGTQDLPEHYLPDAGGTRGVRDNLGFEGLAVSPDGSRLFIAAENALIQDGPTADLDVGSPTRILVIELPGGRPIAEHLYEVGPVPDQPRPASAFRTNGVSEILALDNHRLLVLERSFSVGVGNTVRIYLVDLEGAVNIRNIDSIRDTKSPAAVPLPKTLVANIAEFGVNPTTSRVWPSALHWRTAAGCWC